ncbi:MAG: aquaporin, partial [Acidobacteriota bacterium]
YGLAIGCTVAAAILTVGPISGAVLNPAVALGLAVADLAAWSSLGSYAATQVAGALLATWVVTSSER